MRHSFFMTVIVVTLVALLPAGALAADVVGPYPGPERDGADHSEAFGSNGILVSVDARNGINGELPDVPAGHAHSLWLVTVDNPDSCASAPNCAISDLLFASDRIGARVEYLAGVVAGADGNAVFTPSRNPDADVAELVNANGVDTGEGRTHIMIIDHGPISPDELNGVTGNTNDVAGEASTSSSTRADYEGTPGFTR